MRGNVRNLSDPRVRRTRERLQSAFAQLVSKCGPAAVTIRAVAEKAGVGRSTFYTHYGDIEELHSDWLRGFLGHNSGAPLAFSRAFLEHAHPKRSTWKANHRTQSHAMRRRVKADLLDHIRAHLRPQTSSPACSEATARIVAGAFCELLFWWIDTEAPLSPARLDQLFRECVGSAFPGGTGP